MSSSRSATVLHMAHILLFLNKLEYIGSCPKKDGDKGAQTKRSFEGKKLMDGKPLSGKNSLTNAARLVQKIQIFYGLAACRNPNNLASMKKDVWAIYFHVLSTNE